MRTGLSAAILSLALAHPLANAVGAQAAKPPGQGAQRRPAAQRPGGIQGSELVIVVADKGFDAPSQVEAGLVNVRLFNRSNATQHIAILKVDRLDRVAAIAEYLRAGDWNVPWISRMGGPESSAPGGVSSVSMILEPGRYVVAQLPVAPTHGGPLVLTEVQELSVIRRADGAGATTLPATEVTLVMNEWGFTVEGPLHAGRRTLRVDNKGQFEHHVSIVRLLPGRTMEQAVRWAERPVGAAPFEAVGGTTNVERGRAVNVTVDLMPGDYALLCTTYNPLSKQLHSQHGMVKQIRVVP